MDDGIVQTDRIEKMAATPRTRSQARAQTSSSAFKSVDDAGNTQSRTATGSASAFGCRAARSAATCPLDRNGEGISIPGNGAFLFSRCGHGPRRVLSEVTQDSRSGSIAGFVTCANLCRKYAYMERDVCESGAIG